MKFENQTFNNNTDFSSYELGIDNHKKYKFINCKFDNIDFRKFLDSLGCSGTDTKCYEKIITFIGCEFIDCRWIRRGCPVALYFTSCAFDDFVVMDSSAEHVSIDDCIFNGCSIRDFHKVSGDREWAGIYISNSTFHDSTLTGASIMGGSVEVIASQFNHCKIRDILFLEMESHDNAYTFCIMNKDYVNEETDNLFQNTFISDLCR